MIADIPNYISFPFEIAVALLILWLDRQERRREEKRIKERTKIENKQQARFTNFVTETSKHQMILLESILESLDPDKALLFKKNIQYKFGKEISNDMDDLEKLLGRQMDPKEDAQKIESEITHKMDEIEASRAITSSIFTERISESIGKITNSTFGVLKNISLGDLVGIKRADLQKQMSSVVKTIAKEKDFMLKEFAEFTEDLQTNSEEQDDSTSEKEKTLNKFLKNIISEEDLENLKKIAERATSKNKDSKDNKSE